VRCPFLFWNDIVNVAVMSHGYHHLKIRPIGQPIRQMQLPRMILNRLSTLMYLNSRNRGCCPIFFSVLAYALPATAQLPHIAQGGVVNAASGASPVVPGEIVSIFGTNLATSQQSANAPWPSTLAGTSVTISGVPAPLVFVSPTQINAYVPSSLTTSQSSFKAAPVIVTTSAGSSLPMPTALAAGYPGLFSTDGSGCGQAAALNISQDGTTSINSYSNSAAPGDYISLFGTGFGLAGQQPPDGFAPPGPSALQSIPRLFMDGSPVSPLIYAGLAPLLTGIDQVNLQIPPTARNGCSVPVSAVETFGSPSVTISVQSGRGQCNDPPIQSWGLLSLDKAFFSGLGSAPVPAFEGFSASFPSGPGVQPAAPEPIVYAPNWVGNVFPGGVIALLTSVPINLRTCAVAGYSSLSAGDIQLQPPSGSPVMVQPEPLQTGGVTYSQSLPEGFIAPGIYAISGTQGSPVRLMANLVAGSPIELQTSFPPGTVISSSQPLTVKWTGGDPGTLVRVSLISGEGLSALSDYSYADATKGSLTMPPHCTGDPAGVGGNGVACTFELPLTSNAQISVQVRPDPNHMATIGLPGVTGPVQLTWQYSYNFSGLVLGP
jgi:uncharacterized protein (TIGR03437 family)